MQFPAINTAHQELQKARNNLRQAIYSSYVEYLTNVLGQKLSRIEFRSIDEYNRDGWITQPQTITLRNGDEIDPKTAIDFGHLEDDYDLTIAELQDLLAPLVTQGPWSINIHDDETFTVNEAQQKALFNW